MRDLNKAMVIGNMTRDPEIRQIPSGQSVASFAVATNRSWNDASGELQKAVEYTEVVAWGKLAEIAGQILKKGRRVYVEGRLQTRNWEGQDGVKRYRTEVIASDLIVLDRPPNIGFNGNNETTTKATSMPQTQAQPVTPAASPAPKTNTPEEIDIEDIPF
ncbi:MAG: single-stranded DNA-binding protein [Patescibacteria group bacterium]|nr:single-stranded DNA-binding protein [Patescibacteria group bacterium]